MRRIRYTGYISVIVSSIVIVIFHFNEKFRNTIRETRYHEKIEDLKIPYFTKPENIFPSKTDICVGLILIQEKIGQELEESFKKGVVKMLDSVFKHTEQSLQLIILTDNASIKVVGQFLAKVVTKMLGTHAILSRYVKT